MAEAVLQKLLCIWMGLFLAATRITPLTQIRMWSTQIPLRRADEKQNQQKKEKAVWNAHKKIPNWWTAFSSPVSVSSSKAMVAHYSYFFVSISRNLLFRKWAAVGIVSFFSLMNFLISKYLNKEQLAKPRIHWTVEGMSFSLNSSVDLKKSTSGACKMCSTM